MNKGQSGIMEYLLLSFFVVFAILIVIFFLTWWQVSQLDLEKQTIKSNRAVSLLEKSASSQLMVARDSVFDDSKLMALQSLGARGCSLLHGQLGQEWFIAVQVLNPRPGCESGCDASSYPCCARWEICGTGKPNITRVLPVNVFRKAEERTDLGLLTVGVYG
jgi:hypothetical protein